VALEEIASRLPDHSKERELVRLAAFAYVFAIVHHQKELGLFNVAFEWSHLRNGKRRTAGIEAAQNRGETFKGQKIARGYIIPSSPLNRF
ncbi:MAG TPA: hypothetical protein VNU68_02070, partial [Verrucomicrobiae bacterium]|nr:hypothetical protein [Verrucomicrobiae bacterium]